MLGDSENVIGIGAQYVLAALGTPAIPGLETAAKSPDYRVATKAREALDYLAQQKKP